MVVSCIRIKLYIEIQIITFNAADVGGSAYLSGFLKGTPSISIRQIYKGCDLYNLHRGTCGLKQAGRAGYESTSSKVIPVGGKEMHVGIGPTSFNIDSKNNIKIGLFDNRPDWEVNRSGVQVTVDIRYG